jgi:hypothetical protein
MINVLAVLHFTSQSILGSVFTQRLTEEQADMANSRAMQFSLSFHVIYSVLPTTTPFDSFLYLIFNASYG